jgi:hypothetical protein
MTNKEFCYWLQGLFELGEPKELTVKQMKAIQAHINLARQVDGSLNEFTGWLEGVLEIWQHLKTDLPSEVVVKIKDRLSSKFQHDIDPSYPGDQADLNETHSGGGFNPGGCGHDHLIRC